MRSDAAAGHGQLPVFVRMLWGGSPVLHPLPEDIHPQRARIDADDWYLPAELFHADRGRLHFAMLAHAAAHRQFGLAPMQRGGLQPIQQILVGLLEDARVEWLAMQDLPGLRALWTPFHSADAALTPTLEVLFARLARALLDPAYVDAHPWVARGQRLFFAGREGERGWQPPSCAVLRRVASILGHELGQLRLRLNAGVFEIQPGYRDDNAHIWTMPAQADGMPLPRPGAPAPDASGDDAPGADAPGADAQAARQDTAAPGGSPAGYAVRRLWTREWDYRIRRYRERWCCVRIEAPPVSGGVQVPQEPASPADRRIVQRILSQAHRLPARRRSMRGHLFDLPAVVDARAARRRREPVDPRVYREPVDREPVQSVAIVLDVSASTAAAIPGRGAQTVLERMRRLAFALADAVARSGGRCAVLAFASATRAQVRLQCLRNFGDPYDAAQAWAGLSRLVPGWSSRLGAAVRAAAILAGEEPSGARRRVVLLTDGHAHDIDSHDPRYLQEDLRCAREEARALGVEVVTVDPQALRRRR